METVRNPNALTIAEFFERNKKSAVYKVHTLDIDHSPNNDEFELILGNDGGLVYFMELPWEDVCLMKARFESPTGDWINVNRGTVIVTPFSRLYLNWDSIGHPNPPVYAKILVCENPFTLNVSDRFTG